MEIIAPSEVIALIRSRSARVRTGLWLMPLSYLGHERDEAARLQVDAVDSRAYLLKELPEDARYMGLTLDKMLMLLDKVVQDSGTSDCVLSYNVDLLLASFGYSERMTFWQRLYQSMPHRRRALLVAVPNTAEDILPPAERLIEWGREKRLAGERPSSMEGEYAED